MLSKLGHTVINLFTLSFFSLSLVHYLEAFYLLSCLGEVEHEVDCYLRDTKWNHTCSSTVPIRKETIVACVSKGFQQKTNIPIWVDWLECLQEPCVLKPFHTGWQNPSKYIICLSRKINTLTHASPTLAMKTGSEGSSSKTTQKTERKQL